MIRGIRLVDRLVTKFGGQIMRLQGVLKTMVVDRDGQSERAFRRGRSCSERVNWTGETIRAINGLDRTFVQRLWHILI